MRTIIVTLLISLFGINLFAQSDRESLWLVRINGSYDFLVYQNDYDTKTKANEFSIEAGYKRFIKSNKGFYIEGDFNYYWSKGELPHNIIFYGDKVGPYQFTDKIKERGATLKILFGYDFRFFYHSSLELFTGFEARFSQYYSSGRSWNDDCLKKFYPRWQAGVGINYWRFNLNCTFSTDLCNRANKSRKKSGYSYRLNYLSVGLAYRFGL